MKQAAGVTMGFFKKFTNKLTAPEANVHLNLSNYSVCLGDKLQGNLNVQSQEDFQTTEVRCEILCTEQAKVLKQVYDPTLKTSIPKLVEETSILCNMKPSLAGPTHFVNGDNRNFPINVNIPAGAAPTCSGYDRRVTWTIKGVLAVDGRPDRTSQTCEIQVIAPTVQAAAGQREVVRTIVMIPCKYCQGLMDQTLTVCPNCGAQRTI
jgi:hypothetical protein